MSGGPQAYRTAAANLHSKSSTFVRATKSQDDLIAALRSWLENTWPYRAQPFPVSAGRAVTINPRVGDDTSKWTEPSRGGDAGGRFFGWVPHASGPTTFNA